MAEEYYLRPQVNGLTQEQINRLYTSSLKVLEKTGVKVSHGGALALLEEAGCKKGSDSLVKIPASAVEEALRAVPNEIVMFDRNGNKAMELKDRNTYYGTGSDLGHTYDHQTGQLRGSVAQDIANMAKIVDYLPNMDFLMSYGIPLDRPNHLHYRYEFFEMVKNTTKPIAFTSSGGNESRKIIDMAAAAVGGLENLQAKPFVLNYSQPISPLQHSEESMGKILVCAELGIPVNYPPGLIPGATAPATLAGSMVLSIAEALSGLVIHQLKRPGSPIVLGGAHGCMDMRTMVNVYSGPERLLTMWALSSFYQHFGIPTWGFGGCSDSQVLDEQAGMEFAMVGIWASLVGVNLAHDTAYLGSGMIGALEALVFNDEIISYTKRVMRGILFNDETLAVDLIGKVGPGGHYIGEEHTMKHFRAEFWEGKLVNRDVLDIWTKKGKKQLGEKLKASVHEILAKHKAIALSEDKIHRMENILNS